MSSKLLKRTPGFAGRFLLAWMGVILSPATFAAHDFDAELRACAKRLDAACVRTALAGGAAVDAPDADGKTALLLAVESALDRPVAPKGASETVVALCDQGAVEDMLAVQTLLGLRSKQTVAGQLRAVLEDPNSVQRWRSLRDDARIRAELDLSLEDFRRARTKLDSLRHTGRFLDFYLAYAVARDLADIKHAQALASSHDELHALEHMAVLTVPDPKEIVEPSLVMQRAAVRNFSYQGESYIALYDVSEAKDYTFLVKLRQTPDSRIHLRLGSYVATVDVVLTVYPRTSEGVDLARGYPVVIPVAIQLVPVNYVGASLFRLSDFKAMIRLRASQLGEDVAVSQSVGLKLIRLERLQ